MIAVVVIVAFVAFAFGILLGDLLGHGRRPDVRQWNEHRAHYQRMIAERDQRIARYNAEAEDRETRAYERGRLDQAEVEATRRSQISVKGHATKRERRQRAPEPTRADQLKGISSVSTARYRLAHNDFGGSADGPETP